MKDSIFKSDLFDQEPLKGRSGKRSALRKYSQKQLLPYVKIPVEFLIIGPILILVALVVVYAVGVEVGKIRAYPEGAGAEQVSRDTDQETESFGSVTGNERSAAPGETQKKEMPVSPVVKLPEQEPLKEPEKPDRGRYLIQLASFRSKDVAAAKGEDLKEKGFDAEVQQSNSWYQLVVYGYKTIEEAKSAKDEFRAEYGDCFIRNIEQ